MKVLAWYIDLKGITTQIPSNPHTQLVVKNVKSSYRYPNGTKKKTIPGQHWYIHPKPTLNLKPTICTKVIDWGFRYMALVHIVGFRLCVDIGYAYLNTTLLQHYCSLKRGRNIRGTAYSQFEET